MTSRVSSLPIANLVTTLVVAVAVVGISVAFLNNASPYVTVSRARKMGAERVHLKGQLVSNTVLANFHDHSLSFDLRDDEGALVKVVYSGSPPDNLGEAKDVVAIGRLEGNRFVSDQLLLKCPSKYEGAPKLGSTPRKG